MKLRDMFIPYITIGVILTGLMFLIFGDDRARVFMVTYTVGYAAVMVFLSGSRENS